MSTVFLSNTTPKTIISDYQKLLRQADYTKSLKKNTPVVIKINLSWTKFYPACSTPPWVLEAIVKTLLEDGWQENQIIPVENKTVVTNVEKGFVNNGWEKVLQKYKIKMHFLTNEPYIKYKPQHQLLVMDKVFNNHILLPKIIFDKNIIHLPTLKMHVFTGNTGAIKNYFGMLKTVRHFAHRYIHETIIDLLQIQKEIHPGTFNIMDGTVVGSGSGPRAMEWHEASLLLASADPLAIDSTAARILGLDVNKLQYLQLGNKLKLGDINPETKNISKEKIPQFHFQRADTLASRGQKLIYHHAPVWVEKLLLQSPLVPWSYAASNFYHDVYWYNIVGKPRLKKYFENQWGKLFLSYEKH